MIKENQKLINHLNVISDGVIVFLMVLAAYGLRFYVLPGGEFSVSIYDYLFLALGLAVLYMFTFGVFGLYQSFRKTPIIKELSRLLVASLLDMAVVLSFLFIGREVNFSRWTMVIFFVLSLAALSVKRVLLRRLLRYVRSRGYNQKHVVILGGGAKADEYLQTIFRERDLGYHADGYVADEPSEDRLLGVPYLGTFDELEAILNKHRPDEVVSAIEMADYPRTPQLIYACEKTGTKMSIIPFYSDYMTSNPQFDSIGNIPLLNIRRIPLDNWGNAFFKRAVDIVCSGLLLVVTSPIMLICTIGVKLSSPGPVIFKQERVGRRKKTFYMYKFRSMKVNDTQNTGWSCNSDDRKTKFGSFIRKFSLDEFPQFFNVFKGDMSLVGPRPELPYYVDRFKEEIPLYMVKHQVRPGITGWAQVNGLRGDTSIKERIEHDLYYIEHWSILLDLKILLMTVFGGKFMNDETLN